jgi:hypothetical protein
MRTPEEQRIALECLKLALDHVYRIGAVDFLDTADKLLAFVTGTDVDAAWGKLRAVREAIA